ncbi:MAG: sulfatase-like hydrolase/transferase [Planctomycetota bacterium]
MPRILYLDLDALNPTHLGCYGYHRSTSPTIDAIALEGVRCTNVYCSDAPCLPSRTALYQGRFGIHTGVVGHGGTAADPKREGTTRGFRSTYEEDSFPRQLQKLGLHTAMISPFGQRHAAHQFYAGFHEVHNTGYGGQEPVEVVQPTVAKWLNANAAGENWYLHVNYWDIHTNYRVPLDYGEPFRDEPVADWYTDAVLYEHLKRGGPHSAKDLGMYRDSDVNAYPRTPKAIVDRATLKQWIDGYDTAIRYVDDAIAQIVQMLKDARVYDDTAIIISADHGENQGDLGIYGEHGTADQGTCHIPFIVKWPGMQRGTTDDRLHYHLDWPTTCLELLGRPELCPEVWDGVSFARTLREGTAAGREQLVLSQCAHVCQRAVRFDEDSHRWLYIRTYHDGLHPFPKHMLFDLTTDPHEQNDVAGEHPEVLRDAASRLMDWHDDAMATVVRDCSDVVDPMYTVLHEGGPQHARPDGRTKQPADFRAYLDRLENTGRSAAAQDLRSRYPAYA